MFVWKKVKTMNKEDFLKQVPASSTIYFQKKNMSETKPCINNSLYLYILWQTIFQKH